jgi:hypothetical protein
LIEQLAPLVRGRGTIDVLDIDLDPDLKDRYHTRIPVVELNGRVLSEYHLDVPVIEQALEDALRGTGETGPS